MLQSFMNPNGCGKHKITFILAYNEILQVAFSIIENFALHILRYKLQNEFIYNNSLHQFGSDFLQCNFMFFYFVSS